MTLTVAWIRTAGGLDELVVASDSRLRPFAWDAGPKIFQTPREDCVMAFAGDTFYAYPLIFQMMQSMNVMERSGDGRPSLGELREHLLRVINEMMGSFTDPGGEPDDPSSVLLLAGYCKQASEFAMYQLSFDAQVGRFQFRSSGRPGSDTSGRIAMMGDNVAYHMDRVSQLQRDNGGYTDQRLDMEPMMVLLEAIQSAESHTIGGPVQLAAGSVDDHIRAFVVSGEGLTLLGRPLLEYESLGGLDCFDLGLISATGTLEGPLVGRSLAAVPPGEAVDLAGRVRRAMRLFVRGSTDAVCALVGTRQVES